MRRMISHVAVRIAIFMALIVTASFAQRIQKQNIAVVETQIDESSGAAKDISKAEVREITAEIRTMAVNVLPGNRFNVMTSETVLAMGDAVLIECAEENCVIALGTKIGADYIVRGTISKFGKSLTLLVEIFETEYGMLMASSASIRTANKEELLKKGSAACADMYTRFLERIGAPTTLPSATALPMPSPPLAPSADGSLTDSRDNKTYRTVVMPDGRTWMAENLNYKAENSWCYDNDNANCNKYGRLYDLNTAMNACPKGWSLPTNNDWDLLFKAVDWNAAAGMKLKSRTGWQSKPGVSAGTDQYGFSALPGGYRLPTGKFYEAGYTGSWWSAAGHIIENGIYRRYMMDYGNDRVIRVGNHAASGFSVRCIRD